MCDATRILFAESSVVEHLQMTDVVGALLLLHAITEATRTAFLAVLPMLLLDYGGTVEIQMQLPATF